MKRIFYFAAMALAACAVMVSCEKEETTTKTNRLATPQVTATVGETEVSVSWEAIENAVSYEYTVDDGTAENITATSFTIPVADLTIGSHTVSVKAIPEEGAEYKESRPGTATFNIGGGDVPEPLEPGTLISNMSDLIGTWTVTTVGTFAWPKDPQNPQYVMAQYTNEPRTFDVTISEYGVDTLQMTGWSVMGAEIPALIVKDPSGQTNGIGLVTMVTVGEAQEGTIPTWYAVDVEGSGFPQQPLLAYVFSMREDGTVVGSAMTYNLKYTDGTTADVTVASYEIYPIAVDGSGNYNIYAEVCDGAAGGDFTMVKKNAAPAAGPAVDFSTSNFLNEPLKASRANYVLR